MRGLQAVFRSVFPISTSPVRRCSNSSSTSSRRRNFDVRMSVASATVTYARAAQG